MNTVQRYYLKEFFRLFVIIAAGLGMIFSLAELVDKIDDFIPYRPSISTLFLYSGLNLPRNLFYLMPMAVLISGLFVFSQAGRRRETVAIKAAGGSLKTLLVPFIYSGILLSIVSFLLGEFIVPDLSRKAHRLRDSITKKESLLSLKGGAVWLRAKDYVVRIDLFLPDKGIIKGISIIKIEADTLSERVEAESGEWRPAWGSAPSSAAREGRRTSGNVGRGIWYLSGVTKYNIKTGIIEKYKDLPSDVIDPPEIFREGMQRPEEMNVRELISYTKRLRDAGFRNTSLLVDIHSRVSYPLVNLIMLIIGISITIRGEMRRGLVTATVGIFISLLYWLGFSAALSMGYTGILPPAVAAWTMPVGFGGAAFYLFTKVPE